jgi:hypothetical protein
MMFNPHFVVYYTILVLRECLETETMDPHTTRWNLYMEMNLILHRATSYDP